MSVKDTGLLHISGLTAAAAADSLGRSRQAVSRGIKLDHDYFTPPEVQTIVESLAVKLQQPREKLPDRVKNYILENYSELADIVGANGVSQSFKDAKERSKRVWLFMPRYTWLTESSPQVYASIVDLIGRTDKQFTVFLQGVAEANRFRAVVDKATGKDPDNLDHLVLVEQCEFLASLPTLLIFDPATPTAFVRAEVDGWSPFASMEVKEMLESLLKKLKEKHVSPHG